jgi:hypothetical protein
MLKVCIHIVLRSPLLNMSTFEVQDPSSRQRANHGCQKHLVLQALAGGPVLVDCTCQ